MNKIYFILLLTTMSSPSKAQEGPKLEFFCELNVKVDNAIVVGEVPHGTRRVIPIVGGIVKGSGITGEVMSVGADWQIVRKDGVAELDALYQIKTDEGIVIFVHNHALRVATPEVAAKIGRGEMVDASQYYFRGTTRLEAPPGKYEWVNNAIFICTGERMPNNVTIRFWKVL